jgi:3-dehydroquinate dehydratase-2
MTLRQMNSAIRTFCRSKNVMPRFFQSNCEGEIINCIHVNRRWAQGIVINPGAYTHYSFAIRDAIAAVGLPAVEVHLSDITKREAFRRHSVISEVCIRQIAGLRMKSYFAGIDALRAFINLSMRKPDEANL